MTPEHLERQFKKGLRKNMERAVKKFPDDITKAMDWAFEATLRPIEEKVLRDFPHMRPVVERLRRIT